MLLGEGGRPIGPYYQNLNARSNGSLGGVACLLMSIGELVECTFSVSIFNKFVEFCTIAGDFVGVYILSIKFNNLLFFILDFFVY